MITTINLALRLVDEALRNNAQAEDVTGHLLAIAESLPNLRSITLPASGMRILAAHLSGEGIAFTVEPQQRHEHRHDPGATFKVCVDYQNDNLLARPQALTKYRFEVWGEDGVHLYNAAEYGANTTEALLALLTHKPAEPNQHEMRSIDILPAHPGDL